MKSLIIGLIAIGLMGCDRMLPPIWKTDQKLRTEIFFKCMEALPAGPQETKYNDWDEVVTECDNVARYQARKCVKRCD